MPQFAGRILDADSHEYTPVNLWEEQFGSVVRPFVDAFATSQMPIRRFVPADTTAITAETVWQTKFAIWLTSATLPGGVSPAHPDLDPVWALLAAADAPLLAHLGADVDFLKTAAWRDSHAFEGWKAGEEFQMDPWTLSTLHLPVQNFLATMVMAARSNATRACASVPARCSANGSVHSPEGALPITMKPSDYVRRNVRVSLFDIEPVDAYVEQFAMPEIYCYASDYPHPEGGKDPMGDISAKLAHLGPEVLHQVFVKNAEWILPG